MEQTKPQRRAFDVAGSAAQCRPFTASSLVIEGSVSANGIYCDIRRFAWDETRQSHFETPSYYLDYSLGPRAAGARLIPAGQREAPPPGDIVFLPRGAVFGTLCEPSEHRLLCLTYDDDRSDEIFGTSRREDFAACFNVRVPQVRAGLARLVHEIAEPGFGQALVVEAVAIALAVDICRNFQLQGLEGDAATRLANWRLKRIREKIESEDGTLTVAELARECRMSSRHLIRTFKNTTGFTLSAAIAESRIERAKRELARGDTLIKIVAGNAGFATAAAFSSAFRKATGLTPRQYRDGHLAH